MNRLCSNPAATAAADFYVSAQGNDRWSGKLPEPNAGRSDGPLAGIEQARARRRQAAGEVVRAQADHPAVQRDCAQAARRADDRGRPALQEQVDDPSDEELVADALLQPQLDLARLARLDLPDLAATLESPALVIVGEVVSVGARIAAAAVATAAV